MAYSMPQKTSDELILCNRRGELPNEASQGRIPVLGVDPGKGGGFAFIDPEGVASCMKFPRTFPIDEKEELDYAQLEAFFGDLRLSGVRTAYVERFVKYVGKKQTGASAGTYAYNAGAVRGILEAQKWDIVQVWPSGWMKTFTDKRSSNFPTKSAWKNHLKDLASLYFPYLTVTLSTSDALLIAKYGYNKTNN